VGAVAGRRLQLKAAGQLSGNGVHASPAVSPREIPAPFAAPAGAAAHAHAGGNFGNGMDESWAKTIAL